jgi:AcrR family transcriptional regulator
LTRQRIAQEAVALLDEAGMEGLSMRKLGARLGVEAMSLYHHVRNKADLLDALHGALLENMVSELASRPPAASWETAARGMTMAFLGLLKAHPHAIPLFASRSAIAPGSLKLMDDCIALLMEAGFTPDQSIHAFQTLFSLTLGHAVFHHGPRSQDSYARVAAYAEYPHLRQLSPPDQRASDVEFEFGLDTLLAGLRQRLESLK